MARALPSAPGFTVASLHYVSDRPRRPNDGNGKSNNMNHALKTAIYPGLEAHEIPSNEVCIPLGKRHWHTCYFATAAAVNSPITFIVISSPLAKTTGDCRARCRHGCAPPNLHNPAALPWAG